MWKFYHEQTKDPVLAYALSIKDVQDKKVVGDIYPLDYGTQPEAGRQAEPVPQDTAAIKRIYLKPCTDYGILNIKKDTCW